jgi:hypothetical protein
MKEIPFLHDKEEASTLLVYRYKSHAWEWDCKFWLVNDKWCARLDGTHPVGELDENQAKLIEEYTSIVEQREKENRNWIAFNQCRKRTCLCKSCDKFCSCNGCTEKITNCEHKAGEDI